MRKSAISTAIAIVAYVIGALLAVPLFFETGNRYGWMREIDPQTTTLPVDADAAFRLALLGGGTFLCGVIGLVCSGFVSRQWPKRIVQTAGALLVLLSLIKAFVLS